MACERFAYDSWHVIWLKVQTPAQSFAFQHIVLFWMNLSVHSWNYSKENSNQSWEKLFSIKDVSFKFLCLQQVFVWRLLLCVLARLVINSVPVVFSSSVQAIPGPCSKLNGTGHQYILFIAPVFILQWRVKTSAVTERQDSSAMSCFIHQDVCSLATVFSPEWV